MRKCRVCTTPRTRSVRSRVCPSLLWHSRAVHPLEWSPHLDDFLDDRLRPNAVLLEYIPNLCPIALSKFSENRVQQLHHILLEIHRAGIYHGDPYPRNMMVQEGSDRVLWIDFTYAQTLTPDSMQPYHVEWMKDEAGMMEYFLKALVFPPTALLTPDVVHASNI
ncbi:hypothetical protein BO94DRAFT_602241 [Aspergillus sclerotioniger CBS 115572]|uniref:Protein kinase domain-containing protein n=1 Tax=Aspergillus sclerotioniger CBS 115572 TaxID=1450535 RepID=A0A317W4D8_9EURO|nr:hypothetical protein BO94DRAFT_602241 [Aspergillus sclerotioniger CBS 115572]PWY80849.1 hypothetical protein BO94DRAFT_602241 [Aspergillus sclerotioniger CBS 115572]